MRAVNVFSYPEFIKNLNEDWEKEVTDIFRLLDEECDGVLPRERALKIMELIGFKGEKYIHKSKRQISIQQLIDIIRDCRTRTKGEKRSRWAYLFRLMAGNEEDSTITVDKLQQFFKSYGHVPCEKFCEDFIDEFDRISLSKTDISLEDWLTFCQMHNLSI